MATSAAMASEPSLIEWRKPPHHLKFLITEAPKDSNLHIFIKLFKKYNVSHVVRISEPRYRKESVEEAGISLHVNIFLSFIYAGFNNENITNHYRKWYSRMEQARQPKL